MQTSGAKKKKQSKPRESALFVGVLILHKEAQLTLDLLTVTTRKKKKDEGGMLVNKASSSSLCKTSWKVEEN